MVPSKPSHPRQSQLCGRQAILLGQLHVALGGLKRNETTGTGGAGFATEMYGIEARKKEMKEIL